MVLILYMRAGVLIPPVNEQLFLVALFFLYSVKKMEETLHMFARRQVIHSVHAPIIM